VHKAVSFGLILATFFFTPVTAHPVHQQEDADTRVNVRRILIEATELAIQIESPFDRSVVYARIGDASLRAGDTETSADSFEKALKILDTLPQENSAQDRRDYYRASIASVRARGGDIDGAQQTLALIGADSEKSFAISDIALAQARANNFADAARTASTIQDSDGRDRNLAWIANLQAEAGDIQGAAQLAHSIKNAQYKAQALALIAARKADGGHTEEAHVVVQEALQAAEQAEPSEGGAGRSSLAACGSKEPEQPRDVALEQIVVTQAGAGDFAGALETIRRMHDKAGKENMLATLAGYQARAGDFANARGSIDSINRDSCKSAALHDIVMAHFEAKNLSAALLTVNDMTDLNQKADTLTYLAQQVVEQGAVSSAMGILDQARSIASHLKDDHDRAFLLEQIAYIQAQAGNYKEAAKTLAEAEPAAIAAQEEAKRNNAWTSALPDLIEQQAELGDLDGAWSTLSHLAESDRRSIIQDVARARSKTGDTQGTLAWTARQVAPRDKAFALIGVAEGILQRLETEKK
jgi:tetratricopeptide (TPR) repeat protein